MATLQQLEAALKNADAAGDMDAARKLSVAVVNARKENANLIPGAHVPETLVQAPEPTLAEQAVGVGETGLALATGATGGTLGMLGGTLKGLAEQILSGQFGTPEAANMVEKSAMQGAQAMTYVPRTEAGQRNVQAVGKALESVPPFIPVIGPAGAITRVISAAAVPVESVARQAAVPVAAVAQRVGSAAQRAGGAVRESIGGFGAREQIPPMPGRASVGAAGTPLELQRAAEAEMAGLRLSEGETKRSPELLAWEKEKAKTPEYQAPFLERQQENNRTALMRLESVIDDTGAETGNLSDTGIKVVDTLMRGWAQEKAKTRALYDQFRASNEANVAVDAKPLSDFLNSQPVGVSGITGVTDTARQNAVRLGVASLDADGNLIPNPSATIGLLEDFRQSVSAMSAASSNDKRLAAIIKSTIDDIGEPVAGPALRAMRGQRRIQAQKFENRAIVSRLLMEKRGMDDPQTPIEDVFKKTILTARPSEITHIKRVLHTIGGDEGRQAWKELQGATVRHLRDSAEAGIGADNMPVISAAKLDKALKQMDANGKLDLVLGKQSAGQIRNLNQVLQYIQSTPPMTSINNSGTARTIVSLMAEAGLTGAATGIPLPIVQGLKILRNEITDRKIKARITQSLNYKPSKE